MGQNYPWHYRPPQSAGPEVPKHRSSKDTKRWCKGVVGREHVWTWEPWKGDRSDRGVLIRICTKCRKELQIQLGARQHLRLGSGHRAVGAKEPLLWPGVLREFRYRC